MMGSQSIFTSTRWICQSIEKGWISRWDLFVDTLSRASTGMREIQIGGVDR